MVQMPEVDVYEGSAIKRTPRRTPTPSLICSHTDIEILSASHASRQR